ncbi:bis(5'-nucleosyl)-tetraphosphatase (symmetrical) YqeK [Clostridium saccharoperbutylacetonicum]|uniref:bis(5'-nucleosyl)-tetraphosphatase (symmetrical) n=1 Tax=Clostridium saccharoperbutylacetonicum N1-4(HMT) TaxID=931276 RepID=M1MS01_9CLOT|nr:bis(5'-nucleosyl)-tetraphosphatase (symmetrical) YqeK [Clostridium saccharoperbutylacetonicum]AGF58943.1 metal dependent phosphohydrolase [Clostridium saccharoperbutylacetonicum N1-4(HMT)]NRT60271.1 putative HD superfamily hydrolase involved in NAD metabolism [Clostridium saccharoperbutylacetonicum]NSB23583.1 putative HD superfamily hydrolase involved in NAD metabolism [Clostridium saccharoperbutylacetonicum]NSB42954.1 putative HD superfamily hydrolase involved in NAD metabolism [Clostridium
MLSIEEMKIYLKENLMEKRYIHTLGVAETAKKLAKLNGVSEEKAEIAGLAHDVAKNLSIEKMKNIIEQNGIILSKIEENNPSLWHSIIAHIEAKDKLKIEDEEILDAIRWHTTGKENMSTLTKIIYIADMIEPGRKFEGVEELRKVTFEDLDKGVYAGLNGSLKVLLVSNLLIDDNTIKARNYFLFNSNVKA